MAQTKTTTDADPARHIAREVRVEMVRQELSQQALAERLGWDQRRVSRRLTGEVPFGAVELVEVATALGVPVTQLLPATEPTPGGAR